MQLTDESIGIPMLKLEDEIDRPLDPFHATVWVQEVGYSPGGVQRRILFSLNKALEYLASKIIGEHTTMICPVRSSGIAMLKLEDEIAHPLGPFHATAARALRGSLKREAKWNQN
jgi:hypothetical protein